MYIINNLGIIGVMLLRNVSQIMIIIIQEYFLALMSFHCWNSFILLNNSVLVLFGGILRMPPFLCVNIAF